MGYFMDGEFLTRRTQDVTPPKFNVRLCVVFGPSPLSDHCFVVIRPSAIPGGKGGINCGNGVLRVRSTRKTPFPVYTQFGGGVEGRGIFRA